ncbi:IS66 family insertion sequence element accessory protein TnpB, partial [Thiolapillus sp.]|uniref:IS66 family insertion sequence element accessory protein TnpB n=1 Tax=Thiolapillus sp. TaxID=2017437 RepID=UPI003AF8218A
MKWLLKSWRLSQLPGHYPVRQKLAEDPTTGQLFVFINRRRTQLKVLYFEEGGYCVWSK